MMKLALSAALTVICLVAFVVWMTTRIVYVIQFNIECDDYISQAASSPDPTIAASRLDVAIAFAEAHNLTAGNTGVFFTYPTNDVGFWYKRLTDSRAILRALPRNDAPLEVSNTMMRVRETLVAGGKEGESVVSPDGITVFPHNALFFWWGVLSFVWTLIFAAVAMASIDDLNASPFPKG